MLIPKLILILVKIDGWVEDIRLRTEYLCFCPLSRKKDFPRLQTEIWKKSSRPA